MKKHYGCTVALKSPAHITLIPPFWLDNSRETDLCHSLAAFTHEVPEVEIQLDGFSYFEKRVLFIRVRENLFLQTLQNRAGQYLRQSFHTLLKKDSRPFHPHVTIASRDIKPHDFFEARDYFSKQPFEATFRVSTLSLLKLVPGQWTVIGDWAWA